MNLFVVKQIQTDCIIRGISTCTDPKYMNTENSEMELSNGIDPNRSHIVATNGNNNKEQENREDVLKDKINLEEDEMSKINFWIISGQPITDLTEEQNNALCSAILKVDLPAMSSQPDAGPAEVKDSVFVPQTYLGEPSTSSGYVPPNAVFHDEQDLIVFRKKKRVASTGRLNEEEPAASGRRSSGIQFKPKKVFPRKLKQQLRRGREKLRRSLEEAKRLVDEQYEKKKKQEKKDEEKGTMEEGKGTIEKDAEKKQDGEGTYTQTTEILR